MKLKYGKYLVNGWGGEGFYDETQITGMHSNEFGTLLPVIPIEAVICGTGPGYEDFFSKEDVCTELAELYNSAHSQKP